MKDLSYNLTYKEVVEILRLINGSETCKELRLELGDVKLSIIRGPAVANVAADEKDAPLAVESSAGEQEPSAETAVDQNRESDVKRQHNKIAEQNTSGIPIRAPMVGIFYRAPAPGETPFVDIGAKVGEDDVIGIIDVMKLMNMIKAGQRGIVREICVNDGDMVEYNQVLLILDSIT